MGDISSLYNYVESLNTCYAHSILQFILKMLVAERSEAFCMLSSGIGGVVHGMSVRDWSVRGKIR
jgi:hypothetical protein